MRHGDWLKFDLNNNLNSYKKIRKRNVFVSLVAIHCTCTIKTSSFSSFSFLERTDNHRKSDFQRQKPWNSLIIKNSQNLVFCIRTTCTNYTWLLNYLVLCLDPTKTLLLPTYWNTIRIYTIPQCQTWMMKLWATITTMMTLYQWRST